MRRHYSADAEASEHWVEELCYSCERLYFATYCTAECRENGARDCCCTSVAQCPSCYDRDAYNVSDECTFCPDPLVVTL